MRGASSLSNLLRTLLLHVAHGCSLRTTSVLAKTAGWVSMSDVALLKKLRACEGWLCALCAGLLKDSGMVLPQAYRRSQIRMRTAATMNTSLCENPRMTAYQPS